MKLSRGAAVAAAVSLALTLSACDKKTGGQVVAIVNGEEISISELNQELQGANVPEGAQKQDLQRAVLQRIVDRRLLAQEAKEQGIDRDPAYLARQRRMNEELLVNMYARRAASSVKLPESAAIEKFIRENPGAFSQRSRLTLNQVSFPMPAKPEMLKQFEPDKTLEAVAATATRLGLQVNRGKDTVDTGALPPAMLKQLEALPPGEPFLVPVNGRIVVSVIAGREPIALTAEQSRQVAVEALRNQSLSKIGEARLKDARAKAEIVYEPGFAPKGDKSTAPAAAKK